jgi:hypothetical protein
MRRFLHPYLRLSLVGLVLITVNTGCGSKSPAAPTVTVTGVQVTIAGGGSASLAPGETRQLVAMAARSDGMAVDVTSTASWLSSSTLIATVSPSGLVTAVSEGTADISATYNGARGSVRADVKPTCTIALTPPSVSFGPFGGSATVAVSVNSSSCQWTARSSAGWLPFTASGTGSGPLAYNVPANSTPADRTASLIVETSTAQSAALAITQTKPLGCSYVTVPEELTFSASGGTGQFTVVTTPGDCQWTMVNGVSALGVSVTSGFSGTGSGLVRYSVQAHTRTVDADGYIEIAGLSGLNPNGRHHVVIQKR